MARMRYPRRTRRPLGRGAKGKKCMAKAKENRERECHISMEVVVAAYGLEEQSMYASPSEDKTCVEGAYGISG